MLLYLILLVTSFAMLAILALVFFAARLRTLLKAHLYHRAFSFFAVLTVTGILLASMLSFTSGNHSARTAFAFNRVAVK
jgi:hypothetical protein